jgi:hypothetical protein
VFKRSGGVAVRERQHRKETTTTVDLGHKIRSWSFDLFERILDPAQPLDQGKKCICLTSKSFELCRFGFFKSFFLKEEKSLKL